MSVSEQRITGVGQLTNVLPSERIRVDPQLVDADGNVLGIDAVAFPLGQAVLVALNNDLTPGAEEVWFELQSTAPDTQAIVAWEAIHLHSLQNQDGTLIVPNTLGPNGLRPSPTAPAETGMILPESNWTFLVQPLAVSASFHTGGRVNAYDTTDGAIAHNLPASPIAGSHFYSVVYAGANDVTLNGNGNNIINAGVSAATLVLTPGQSAHLHYNALLDVWMVLSLA